MGTVLGYSKFCDFCLSFLVYGQNYKHENTLFIDRTGQENTQLFHFIECDTFIQMCHVTHNVKY